MIVFTKGYVMELSRYKEPQLSEKIGSFREGDTVRVNFKIKEGDRERIQAFEGVVLKYRKAGVGSSFTVRRVVQEYGVERIFPLYSPLVDSVNVVKQGSVRRSKLYYLRGLSGKKSRIKERKK